MYESNKITNKRNTEEYLFNFLPSNKILSKKYHNTKLSVNIYLFDALSRLRYFNQMPYTNNFINTLKTKYYIYSFELYHTIGLNSKPNYFPLFYGSYEDDKNPKAFIYSFFIKHNFTIISNLAECDTKLSFYNSNRSSIFNIRHNLQISCLANINHFTSKERCVGSKQHHEWQLEYLEESLKYYNYIHKNTFSYTSFDEAHDSSFISITRVDNDFARHLNKLYCIIIYYIQVDSGFMNSSINIIMSDHGMHYGKYSQTNV